MFGSCGRRTFLLTTLGVAMFPLTGCGKGDGSSGPGGIEGAYQTVHGETVVQLSGGTASITNWKASKLSTFPYTVEGDKITLKGPSGSVVLTKAADGSLTGVPEALSGLPASTVLKKSPS